MEKRKRGRPRKFQTPAQLLEAAEKYFDWCDRNPWYKCEKTKDGDIIGVPIQRPYSIVGFCVFLGCSECFWWDLKNTTPRIWGNHKQNYFEDRGPTVRRCDSRRI